MATATPMAIDAGFFSLPGEIRNQIYQHVLSDFVYSAINERTTEDFSESISQRFPNEEHKAIPLGATGHLPQPAFSQTCRTVQQEILTMLYATHIFVGSVVAVRKFLLPLAEESRRKLRRVCITWPTRTDRNDLAAACLRHVRDWSGADGLKDGCLRFEMTPKADPERTVWVSERELEGVQASAAMMKVLARRSLN